MGSILGLEDAYVGVLVGLLVIERFERYFSAHAGDWEVQDFDVFLGGVAQVHKPLCLIAALSLLFT